MKILLIEDHADLVATLSQSLGALGIDVDARLDGVQGEAALREHDYDAVVLDLALPRLPGLDLLARLRARGDMVPVLALTASGDIEARVRGLNAGADDYLPKPFDLSELEARLRAMHRRRLGAAQSTVRVGTLEFDTVSRRFLVAGKALDLPRREQHLLEALVAQPGRPISKLALARRLCTADAVLSDEALEVYVHRLRRRLAGSTAAIHTLRGLGYVLEVDDAASA